MYKAKKVFIKFLMVLLLSFSTLTLFGPDISTIAEAAVKAPSMTTKNKTMYVGYKTHKIQIKNKSSKASIKYKSSNVKVATVTSSGTVKPVAAGKATITATVIQNDSTYYLKVQITVKKPHINMSSTIDYLNVLETNVFKVNSFGTSGKVVWSVSNDKKASINKGGKLVAKEPGEVTVYASVGNLTTSYKVQIGSNRIGSFSKNIACYDAFTMWISLSDVINDEYLDSYTKSDTLDVIDWEWGNWTEDDKIPITIYPKSVGNEILIITSSETSDRLYLDIHVTEKPMNRESITAKEIYQKCGPGTVEITSYSSGYEEGLGSGFFINDNIIITNYHVIEGADKLVVKTTDKKVYDVEYILGYDTILSSLFGKNW